MSAVTVDGIRDELIEDATLLTLMEQTEALECPRGFPLADEDVEDLRSAQRNWDDIF
jgi:hypothetical protein